MSGKVAYVGRVADPQTGNLPVHILVENPEGRLTLGAIGHVTITVEERPDVLQVPATAILDLGEGPVLSVVRDGKTVVLHPELGTPHGGLGRGLQDRPQGRRAGDRRRGLQPARGDPGQDGLREGRGNQGRPRKGRGKGRAGEGRGTPRRPREKAEARR